MMAFICNVVFLLLLYMFMCKNNNTKIIIINRLVHSALIVIGRTPQASAFKVNIQTVDNVIRFRGTELRDRHSDDAHIICICSSQVVVKTADVL